MALLGNQLKPIPAFRWQEKSVDTFEVDTCMCFRSNLRHVDAEILGVRPSPDEGLACFFNPACLGGFLE